MSNQIINRVAGSAIISLDLEDFYPKGERVVFDIKGNLYEETILREKEFRLFIKEHNWSNYKNKNIAITCSVDAIVPTWAFMLIASKLSSVANHITFGTLAELEKELFTMALNQLNVADYQEAKVVVKGCSGNAIPTSAYVDLVRILQPVVSSLMFGEPCSTVPVYKKPKK
ncbi:MAG: DUF2480 family protein [Cyclobacteriaceae bacterium]|nr:DUF2480 family protein [Cyclobacteriaceae bacterium]